MTSTPARSGSGSGSGAPGGLPKAWLRTRYIDRRLSFKAIARLAGCSDVTVAAAVRWYGLVRPELGDVAKEVADRAVSMYVRDGRSVREVAASLALPRDRVTNLLRGEGVRLRGRGARPTEHLDVDRLRNRYQAGASLRELANEAQTGDLAIRAAFARSGAAVRGRGRVPRWDVVLTPAFLLEQVARGFGAAQIAESVGCSSTTVRTALRRHGLTHPK